MPLKINDQQLGTSGLAVWDILESEEELMELCAACNDLPRIASLPLPHQRLEKLAVRVMMQTLIPKASLTYSDTGKPIISEGNISISHSHGMAALLHSKRCRAGIDIERIGEKIVSLASRFTSREELAWVNTFDASAMLHVIWGAKESLYKLHGQKELDFREHIRILPFTYENKGTLAACILKHGEEESFTVSYERLGDHMLTWVLSPQL